MTALCHLLLYFVTRATQFGREELLIKLLLCDLAHGSCDRTEVGSGRIRWFVIQFAAITLVWTDKTTDKFSRIAAAGNREGMPTKQMLQMPAVRTDPFSITGFATFTTKGIVIKRNLQTTESSTSDIYGCAGHCSQYTIHSELYTINNIIYTMHYTL
jgi:hypothetical protein